MYFYILSTKIENIQVWVYLLFMPSLNHKTVNNCLDKKFSSLFFFPSWFNRKHHLCLLNEFIINLYLWNVNRTYLLLWIFSMLLSHSNLLRSLKNWCWASKEHGEQISTYNWRRALRRESTCTFLPRLRQEILHQQKEQCHFYFFIFPCIFAWISYDSNISFQKSQGTTEETEKCKRSVTAWIVEHSIWGIYFMTDVEWSLPVSTTSPSAKRCVFMLSTIKSHAIYGARNGHKSGKHSSTWFVVASV